MTLILMWRRDFIVTVTQQICFSLLPQKFLGVFTNKPTTFFINVLTWCGQQKAPKALLYQCYVPFINKKCLWHYKESRPFPSWDKLLSRLGVLSNLPPLSIFDMFHAIGGRVKAHYEWSNFHQKKWCIISTIVRSKFKFWWHHLTIIYINKMP